MRTLAELASEATEAKVRLDINPDGFMHAKESTDSLFHTPLLALTILVISHLKKDRFATVDLTTWTLGTLSNHFESLRISRSRFHWSVSLRRRNADALVFLENLSLVKVEGNPNRILVITDLGRALFRKASRQPDEIGLLVRQLARAYRALEHTGLELL
jgi:hypothetical protein